MTSGLRLVEWITLPMDRGALTGAFYAAAYAGMTMPVVVATVARPIGYTSVLAILTVLGGDRLGLAHPRNACDDARPTGARAGQSVAATQSPVTAGSLAIASISSSAAIGRAK